MTSHQIIDRMRQLPANTKKFILSLAGGVPFRIWHDETVGQGRRGVTSDCLQY